MWTLLQFVSGSITKNTTDEFVPVLKLLHLLYGPAHLSASAAAFEPLAVPDVSMSDSVRRLAACAIYIHLAHKVATTAGQGAGGGEGAGATGPLHIQFPLPAALTLHHEYLMGLSKREMGGGGGGLGADYVVPIVANTFSTATEIFTGPRTLLVTSVGGENKFFSQLCC